jgi:predicted ester cyclase
MLSTVSRAGVVERLWSEAFNAGDLDVLPQLVHEEFVNFGQRRNGPQFLRGLITAQRTAFPDMRFETLQTIDGGDWVLTRVRWTGTFVAPFPFIGLDGVEPTGRSFDVEHAQAFRFVEDKIAEHWAVRDDLTMHRQLLGPAQG